MNKNYTIIPENQKYTTTRCPDSVFFDGTDAKTLRKLKIVITENINKAKKKIGDLIETEETFNTDLVNSHNKNYPQAYIGFTASATKHRQALNNPQILGIDTKEITHFIRSLKQYKRQLYAIQRSLGETKENPNSITEEDIQLAREYPISNIVELRKRGTVHVGLCPLHKEKTPSFTVFNDNNYKCFGCQAHGDVINLVMELKKYGFVDAVKSLI